MRALTTKPNPATLAAFRRLMRARAALFADDAYALDASRTKLRDEFLAHRGATDAGDDGGGLSGMAEARACACRFYLVPPRRRRRIGSA